MVYLIHFKFLTQFNFQLNINIFYFAKELQKRDDTFHFMLLSFVSYYFISLFF